VWFVLCFFIQWDDLLNSSRSTTPSKNSITHRPGDTTKGGKNGNSKESKTNISGIEEGSESESESESGEPSNSEDEDEFDETNITAREQQQKKESLGTLGKQLSVLVGQLEDLRFKYSRSKEQNDKMEAVNKELMTQIDTLEDENTELQDNLKEKLEDAKKYKLLGGGGGEKKRGGGGGRRLNNPVQKKDQGFNLALISDNDVDDNHLDMVLGKSKSVIEKYAQKLFDYVPFKRDIQEIRSTFGGATASYFSFFRWM
jgi:hypothetical protein